MFYSISNLLLLIENVDYQWITITPKRKYVCICLYIHGIKYYEYHIIRLRSYSKGVFSPRRFFTTINNVFPSANNKYIYSDGGKMNILYYIGNVINKN